MEDFNFWDYDELKSIMVMSDELLFLEFDNCKGLEKIEVDA